MVGRRLLRVAAGAAVLIGLSSLADPPKAFALDDERGSEGSELGAVIGAGVGDNAVDLTGELTSPLRPDFQPGFDIDNIITEPERSIVYDPRDQPGLARCDADDFRSCEPKGPIVQPPPPPPGTPAVTLIDIASFIPTPPTHGMQPDGWAVVNLPANFIADAATHVVSGTLLGQPADVRFTPLAFEWQFGDGAGLRNPFGGAPWASIQTEFSETPTSHIYDDSGTYTTQLAVIYAAEYRFASAPWTWIAGTLTIPAPPRDIVVGEFDTVLVNSDCRANPSGPGC